ncbi:MAG TPA: hypothetical protein VK497_04635 [Candidatus Saccharimonadales bacterium]|nr:hypothetical protein [Candidatus Saccharimonadales bacterium]
MNHYIQATKTYITTHRKKLAIGAAVILGIIVLITAIVLFVRNSTPKIVYQPANACGLITLTEAKELLGNNTLNSNANNPVVSGNTAASRCGYTDGNPDTNNMIVAAIIVRSGVNDKGVQQNKTDFEAGKPSKNIETVKNLGDSAYFNQKLGQLNILDGREWIILSYGVGSAPEANTVDKAIELARKVLPAFLTNKF